MTREQKQQALTYLLFSFFLLSIVSSFFVNSDKTFRAYSPAGHYSGALTDLQNGCVVEQVFEVNHPAALLNFSLFSGDYELETGTVTATLTSEADGTILAEEVFHTAPDRLEQIFVLWADIPEGSNRLTLQFSDFSEEDLSRMMLNLSRPTRDCHPAILCGEPLKSALLFNISKEAEVHPLPLFAVLLCMAALFLTVLLRWKKAFWYMMGTGAVCAAICLFGLELPLSGKLLHYLAVISCVAVLAIGYALFLGKQTVCAVRGWLVLNAAWIQRLGILFAISAAAGAGAELICFLIRKDGFLPGRWFFFAALFYVVGYHICFRKEILSHPERSFLVTALAVGLCLSLLAPATTLVSWDDEIHYTDTLYLSQGFRSYFTHADTIMRHHSFSKSFSLTQLKEESLMLDQLNSIFSLRHSRSAWMPGSVGYVPHVFGIWLGTILSLPFLGIFLLGRTANMVFYVFVLYLAMKRLKSGKWLLYAFALLPTNLFLAASYTYDSWVTAMVTLGFAWFIGAMQRPEEPIGKIELAVMLLAPAVGVFPKAIYGFLIPIMLVMPRSKFADRKAHRRYLMAVLGATALTILVYVIPFLLQGAFSSSTDARGGSDVSAIDQILFILTHPLAYTKILLQFLWDYLAPSHSYGYTSFMAYLNGIDLHFLLMGVLAAAAVLDRNGHDLAYRKPFPICFSAVVLFGVVCLVATALYITFTPVGYYTINGCQPRYLLPILYPAFAIVGNLFQFHTSKEKYIAWGILTLSSTAAFLSIGCNIAAQLTI